MAERDEARRIELFEELARTGSVEARNELVESYAPLAEFFANRYKQQATDPEDLRQVAHLALVKAVDRFDHTFGVQFSTFAGRTIDGELKRYFRDRTWAVRVPRSLKETALEIRNLVEELSTEKGRPPTVPELAAATGYDLDLIVQALDVQTAQRAKSIDEPVGSDGESIPLGSALGSEDRSFDRTEIVMTMQSMLAELDDRDRRILELRFYEDLTQQEIADRLGMSQMHVSRLLRSALELLRTRYHR